MDLFDWINRTNDNTDVEVVDDYDESCCCSVCGTMRLTNKGIEYFSKVLNKEVEECDGYLIVKGIRNDHEVNLLCEMIEGFAGYISESRWCSLFRDSDLEDLVGYEVSMINSDLYRNNEDDFCLETIVPSVYNGEHKRVGMFSNKLDAIKEFENLKSKRACVITTDKKCNCIGYVLREIHSKSSNIFIDGCSDVVLFDKKKLNNKNYVVEIKAESDMQYEFLSESKRPLSEICETLNFNNSEYLCSEVVDFRICNDDCPLYEIYFDGYRYIVNRL